MTNPDTNVAPGRVVGEATAADGLPADLEAAWAEWSKSIKNVDERGMTLLRAAFEAGVEVATAGFARRGGQKGGAARAAKLSPEERSEIARKAARVRWGDGDYSSGSSG